MSWCEKRKVIIDMHMPYKCIDINNGIIYTTCGISEVNIGSKLAYQLKELLHSVLRLTNGSLLTQTG